MDLSSLTIPAQDKVIWSPYQEAIFATKDDTENILIEAVAGAGKTKTIVHYVSLIGGNALYLAFNKSAAEELREKVIGQTVKTINALGHGILTKRIPGVKLDTWKVSNAVKTKLNTAEYTEFGPQTARLVSLAKGQAFGILIPADVQNFMKLATGAELDIPFDYLARAATVANTVFEEVINDFTSFDFDDQLFLPVFHDWTFPTFDVVLIDEAQDLNPIQHLMLSRLADKGARIIAVGDTNQAIYGFRGALHNSMRLLSDTFNMKEFPLSVTYRCDQKIVNLAQEYVPHIRARDNAPPGLVNYTDSVSVGSIADDSLVICRNNAPIFSLAMRFLIERRPVRVLSNFIGQLKGFIKSFKTRDLKILEDRLKEWYKYEYAKAIEAEFHGRAQYIEDKYETVMSLIREAEVFDDVLVALDRFGSSTSGPTLSTIHKAKGLEASTCIILNREKLPSRYAVSEEALQQENNLIYVGITRARNHLKIHHGVE